MLVLGLAVPTLPAVAVENPATASTALSASGKEGDGGTLKQPKVQSGSAARSGDISPVPAPECPPVLMSKCSFDPAAYHLNDPEDITNYGNYDQGSRPADGTRIKGVTVHDIEGTCEEAAKAFKDPLYFVSATYLICSDGRVIQMVLLCNITWTSANWWDNTHFVQIEVAGHASDPFGYSNAAILSLAFMIKWLSQTQGFLISKGTVHGHDNVQAVRTSGIARQHVDPGMFFPWQTLFILLGAPVLPSGNVFNPSMVTVAPIWPLSKLEVTGCNVSNHEPPPCVPEGGPFATNFVYMQVAPDHNPNAALVTDPVTGPGSKDIENRSARAFYGSKFKVIERKFDSQGVWYKVWFAGQGAWFHSPYRAPTAMPSDGECATPKGTAPVQTFGRPVPEQAEWDAKIAELHFTPPAGSTPTPSPLAYTIPAGQCYSVIQKDIKASHYYSWSFDNMYPRFRLEGATKYVRVFFNGRELFLKQSDVTLAG